jgi:hypothetical protein
MARKRKLAKYPDRKYGIALTLTGAQKNEIVKYAESIGVSVNELMVYCALTFVRNERGIPEPGPAQFKLPTFEETLAGYIRGEHVLTPCGKTSCDMVLEEVGQFQFCKTCNIRVN